MAAAGPLEDGMAAYGRGDYDAAARLFREDAGQRGNARAEYMLAACYGKGQGVPQDLEQAAYWYRKSADQGYADAQDMLSWAYLNGKGVPQDYVQALLWLDLAAAQDSDDYADARDTLASKMTSAQIAEARRLMSEWKPKPIGPRGSPVRRVP